MSVKSLIAFPVALGLVLSIPAAGAVDRVSSELDTPGTSRLLVLPPAADHAPVISLGTSVDPRTGKVVEGFAIIHYRKGYHHRDGHGGGPGGGDTNGSKCFSFLAQGAKWRTVEPWMVNPSNLVGLDGVFVANNLTQDIAKWEDATDGVLGNGAGNDVLGNGSVTDTVLVADTASPDGANEVYFADVAQPGAIAVTIVWGIFAGPPSARELVEWDQVYDDADFVWSSTGAPGAMDFENIATHELGHSVGMGHPDDSCTEETMYRFAADGETKKRDLHTGDVAGMNKLY